MRRIFFDMDGTLCEFRKEEPLINVMEAGYFLGLAPHENMIKAVKRLTKIPEVEVFILSSVFSDHKTAKEEKREWLSKHLGFIDEKHIIFSKCGLPKSNFISEKCPTDILVDDFGQNLSSWHGLRVKVSENKLDAQKDAIRYAKCVYPDLAISKIVEIVKSAWAEVPTPFVYGGCHFLPERAFSTEEEGNPSVILRRLKEDIELGLYEAKEHDKSEFLYSWKSFYEAATNKACDLFRCLENGKLYVPCGDSLLIFTEA